MENIIWKGEEINEEISNGWIVVCESPLEIEHQESNSFANGIGAEIILDSILS